MPVTILEADPEYVGGIARTAKYKGYHFDIGGHRFFSKSKEVEDLWTELLPDDMLDRPRSSPHLLSTAVLLLSAQGDRGPVQARHLRIDAAACCRTEGPHVPRPRTRRTSRTGSRNQFGKRLFNIFFKTYTEKVWGMSCKEISADWAAQRIKGLSLKSAISTRILPKKQAEGQEQGHQVADRHLPLSAPRPRHDVGSLCRQDQGHGRRNRTWA